jgi:2,3-bisphosphoglycerate-independent phosphoglycerate mutase
MDRDKRWERIERAFNAMVLGNGEKATDPTAAAERSYEKGVTDEFIEPVTIVDDRGHPVGLIRDEDAVIFFNFRADRAREITVALTDTKLERPSRSLAPKNLHYVTMTRYDKTFSLPYVLPPEHPDNILANVMAQLNWKNLRVAETEKYAHVTYFFNGAMRNPIRVKSASWCRRQSSHVRSEARDESAGITDVIVKAVEGGSFDVIVMNFANADMVGHSGKMEPTVRAVETVDACLGRIYQVLRARNGAWIITADHGNAETIIDPVTRGPHTYHTTNPVPLILVTDDAHVKLRAGGSLRDIAPTLLAVLGESQPKGDDGRDLRSQ